MIRLSILLQYGSNPFIKIYLLRAKNTTSIYVKAFNWYHYDDYYMKTFELDVDKPMKL